MLREESFEHQNRTCYRRELEGCPVEITESTRQAKDLYYKRLERSLSKNFDEDNASTKPQKFVDVDSEC